MWVHFGSDDSISQASTCQESSSRSFLVQCPLIDMSDIVVFFRSVVWELFLTDAQQIRNHRGPYLWFMIVITCCHSPETDICRNAFLLTRRSKFWECLSLFTAYCYVWIDVQSREARRQVAYIWVDWPLVCLCGFLSNPAFKSSYLELVA